MPNDFKKLIKDKRLLAVAGVGGALGVGVAVARKKGAGVANPADLPVSSVTAPYVPLTPATYDSSLSDIYEGFNQTALDLQNQINAIGDQLDQTTPPTATTPSVTTTTQLHRVSRIWNLREYAKRFAPNPASASSVEAELRRIVAANPALKGRTTIPSGFAVKTPVVG